MKFLFAQTAKIGVKNALCSDYLEKLPEVILKHTDWEYSYKQTDTGCSLKPTFRNMPYRNSFVPAIDIVVSHKDAETVLCMMGLPVKSVRIFMAFWFALLLMAEIVLLAPTITSALDSIFPVFIPVIMCAFGYFLCKIATQKTFASVVKAIEKEFT